jgi:flotillin
MLGGLAIPIVIIVGVLAIVLAFVTLAKNYIKVPPEKGAVVYGKKQKIQVGEGKERERGFRLIRGGAAFVLPFFEKVSWLDLGLMTIPLTVQKVPSKDGVPVNVEAIANVKIGGTDDALEKAAEQFGGRTPEQIIITIRETMEGHLRAIVGQLTPEELYQDRSKFSQEVQKAATEDIAAMGFEIISFPIKDVRDSEGYIDALGKKRVAEVKMEASIGEANAKRKEMIETSLAIREGKEADLKNQEMVSEAERNLSLKKAKYKAEVDKEQATAEQAGPLAAAEAQRGVKIAVVAAQEAETTAKIKLATQEALRKEEELVSTVIKPALAAKEEKIIEAKANEEAAIHNAEVVRVTATAAKEKTIMEGEGTSAALQANGEAAAAVDKAKLVAKAEGKKADLLAEAEGKEKLAAALAKLDATGKLLQVLEQMPIVSEAAGNALAKALGPDGLANVFGQIAAPMGSIDQIKILDMGGGSQDGKGGNAVSRLANVGPEIVFNFLTKVKALGLDAILDKVGINSKLIDEFMSTMQSDPAGGVEKGLKKVAEAIKVAKTGPEAGSNKDAGKETTDKA